MTTSAGNPSINGNRHEHPRRQSLASAGVADRHPILTHGLDGRRDIAVGVAQELLGLAGLVCRSEQRTALIVFTVNQDGQEQSVIDVAGVEQRRPSRYSRSHGGVESQTPGARIDVAVRLALMDRFERVLLIALWCCAAAEIAANSGVPPWLKASASIASSGQIQSSGLIDTGPATIAAM